MYEGAEICVLGKCGTKILVRRNRLIWTVDRDNNRTLYPYLLLEQKGTDQAIHHLFRCLSLAIDHGQRLKKAGRWDELSKLCEFKETGTEKQKVFYCFLKYNSMGSRITLELQKDERVIQLSTQSGLELEITSVGISLRWKEEDHQLVFSNASKSKFTDARQRGIVDSIIQEVECLMERPFLGGRIC